MGSRLTVPGAGSRSRAAVVIWAGLVLTAAVVLAQAAGQWIDFHYYDLRLTLLDSDHHRSVFGAISVLAQGAAAAALGLRVITSARGRPWLPVGLIVGLLVAALAVARTLVRYEAGLARHEVAILAPPLVLVALVVCWLTLRDPGPVRAVVWGSLGLLACSFALHAVGLQAEARKAYVSAHTWGYQVTGMLKHGTELAGWMLLATGLVASAICTRSATSKYFIPVRESG